MKKLARHGGAGLLIAGVLLYVVPCFFSLPDNIEQPPPQGQAFADRNGTPLRRFLTGDGLRVDSFIAYGELPRSLVEATLAVEDQRFFKHLGVDYIGICRAAYDSVMRKKMVSGASTITQQLIKISSPPRKRDFKTKLLEIARARKLEFSLGKPEILAAYLNRLPYGNQLTGCEAAARQYFGKPVSDLSLAESAFLAGLPNRPSYFNPYHNFAGAKKRQLWVLKRMQDEKYISREQFEVAASELLTLQPRRTEDFRAPHFVELYLQHHSNDSSDNQVIRTSLDLQDQTFVEDCVTRTLGQLSGKTLVGENSEVQAAVVVIDNPSGEILALTGSRSFFNSEAGQVNGAWAARSAGSTLKPFTYMMALEKGWTAASVIPDISTEYVSEAGSFFPVNFDRRFNGPVSLRRALATSLNVPAIRVLKEVGGPRALHQVLQDHLGLTSLAPDGNTYGLGLTIGNAEARLLELTNAYACLGRLGVWKPYRFTQQGTVDDRTLFGRENAWILADILSDNSARVPAFGINSALQLPFKVAVKTGTSTDFRDSWTIGYTPEFTVGVWLGHFDNRPLPKVLAGSLGAGPIFHEVMLHLHKDRTPTWYPMPAGIVKKKVDRLNGLLIDSEAIRPRETREEYFVVNHLPEFAGPQNYTEDGKTLLPALYTAWWNESASALHQLAALEKPVDAAAPNLMILSPLSGTIAYLDPDLPAGGQKFPLRFSGGGKEGIEWASPSLNIERKGDLSWVILQPGSHLIEAQDKISGQKVVSKIVVERL